MYCLGFHHEIIVTLPCPDYFRGARRRVSLCWFPHNDILYYKSGWLYRHSEPTCTEVSVSLPLCEIPPIRRGQDDTYPQHKISDLKLIKFTHFTHLFLQFVQ